MTIKRKHISQDFDPMTDIPDNDLNYSNDDYDSGIVSYTEQCAADRSDYANELLRSGKIDKEQADEIKFGA